ncbi:unnamed protein product [Paramecium pentaurelia]|uniref:Uncharacterized protein n=1 Tax=Paramecium pentaurelia TaxID=43138 RepID=A0A8S1X490_9CILI|nr:unnamed protein product [Paramecium pentaurelia]
MNQYSAKQHLQSVLKQTQIQEQILTQSIQKQIEMLNQEIYQLDNNNNLTNNQIQYYKNQYQQQLIQKLKDLGQAKSIPEIKQNNEDKILIYVLIESLLRDQNRELLITSQQYSFGFDSIIGAYGSDQSCLKVSYKNLDFDKIMNDNLLFEEHLLEFQQKLSISLNISIDQIEILGVSKERFEISFQIIRSNHEEIQQQINNSPNTQKFLNEYCNGQIEHVAYFDQARAVVGDLKKGCSGVALSFEDFNPQFNMSWDNFNEKEQRGPPYHRYDYYFPRGCYGFGLKIKNYKNNDWLKMDGNVNEWRILYHGTKNFAVNSNIENNLVSGSRQVYAADQCMDEFGNEVKVGTGIYFSDQYTVCIEDGFAEYIQLGNKLFALIFMSRVNPKKIRQSERMKKKNYFVVNNSEDVRPYRILFHQKKDINN